MIIQETTLNSYRQEANAGQVARLKLMPIQALLELIQPGEGIPGASPDMVASYGLNVAAGSTLTELIFPKGSCSFTESSSTDANGTSWSLELLATIPKNQAGLLAWIHRNKGQRWLALFLDRNGQAYVAGEPDNGLRLEVSRAIGAGNSVAISLKGRSWHPTYCLETFDTSVLFADVDFDFAFDFSFNA